MDRRKFSSQGQQLLDYYAQMATDGYERSSGEFVSNAFSDFELRKFRNLVKPFLEKNHPSSLLDYGSGGADWHKDGFDPDSGSSAKEFFKLEKVSAYEPARDRDDLVTADCVTCIDVLEHIFITDIKSVLHDIFSLASRCVVLNIACYQAAAQLPNGENAHITVRNPLWWKGVVDLISIDYSEVNTLLICSETYTSGILFDSWRAEDWHSSNKMVVAPPTGVHFGKQPSS